MSCNPIVWLVSSPLNPYWLIQRKMSQANAHILASIAGKVLEVGAGDGARKEQLCQQYPKITEYIATDYSSWDGQFSNISKRVKRLGAIGEALFGFKERIKLDQVCSATDLPFKANSFDWHLSFETLEHISDPDRYFAEAARVVKSGGKVALSVPYLFRVHGGEPDHREDYLRPAPGFFYVMAKRHGLKVDQIYTNTGLGSSVASLTNAWLIRCCFESPFIIRGVVVLLCPIVFLLMNTAGWLIDLWPDKRFATRWHVVMHKKA